MKCMECGKALQRYSAQVTTPGGEVIGWGPKCARRALKSARKAASVNRHAARPTVDERQMALEFDGAMA